MTLATNNKEGNSLFKQYLFFWGGQLFSMLGSNIVQFVLILWISFEKESELMLGLASIVGFGPFLFLGPLAGVIVDRTNRKMVILIADATIAITTLAAIFLFYIVTGVIIKLKLKPLWTSKRARKVLNTLHRILLFFLAIIAVHIVHIILAE